MKCRVLHTRYTVLYIVCTVHMASLCVKCKAVGVLQNPSTTARTGCHSHASLGLVSRLTAAQGYLRRRGTYASHMLTKVDLPLSLLGPGRSYGQVEPNRAETPVSADSPEDACAGSAVCLASFPLLTVDRQLSWTKRAIQVIPTGRGSSSGRVHVQSAHPTG